MKALRLTLCIGSGVLAALGAVAGCSGDDTIVSGGDSGSDATATDGAKADGTTGADTGTADTGTADTGVDSGNAVDSGDAGFDAPARTVSDFTAEVATAVCATLEKCCQALDAGGTSAAKCNTNVLPYGFQGSSLGVEDLVTADASTNLTVDPVQAAICLAQINTLSCAVNSTTMKSTIQACYNAIVGKVAKNGSCQFAPECVQPGYCMYAVPDAGSGTCQPLVATTGSCAAVSANVADPTGAGQEACSSKGSGFPATYCDNLDNLGNPLSSDQWKCKTAVATDAGACFYNNNCTSDICDTSAGFCGDILQLATVAACNNLH
jgi:hypothetical protein